MNRFTSRSQLSELIDTPGIPFNDWNTCLRELNFINTWLGGHRTTVEGLEKVMPEKGGSLSIAEIGCGGGDNLKAIHAWNMRRITPLNIRYFGIDLNKACIDFARENCALLPSATFIHADYEKVRFVLRPDIIFSSLFCHHLTETGLSRLLNWLKQNAGMGFFMNDLHRSPLAYYSIRALTLLFSRSYLVKNDAPVSVLRSFKKKEWRDLLQRAGFEQYEISWRWAFRYLVSVRYE